MRVAIISRTQSPDIGGPPAHVRELVDELHRRGYLVARARAVRWAHAVVAPRAALAPGERYAAPG